MGTTTWTQEMEWYLEDKWGKASMETLIKKLGKTEKAIELKAQRLELGSMYNTGEYLTANQVAKLLHVDIHAITDYWIPKCGLKVKKRAIKKRKVYQIDLDTLQKWLKDNTDKWNSIKVELYALGFEPDWLKEKRKNDIERPNRNNQVWTDEETSLLLSYYKTGLDYKHISKSMNRTEGSIKRKIDRIRATGELSKKRILVPWTKEEDETICKMDSQNKTDEEIAWELGREKIHVQYRRAALIEKGEYPASSKPNLVIKERLKKIMKLKEKGLNDKQIAKKLDVHVHTIYRNLKRMER